MYLLQYGVLISGVVSIIVGYRQSNRDLLLLGALLTFVPPAIDSFY